MQFYCSWCDNVSQFWTAVISIRFQITWSWHCFQGKLFLLLKSYENCILFVQWFCWIIFVDTVVFGMVNFFIAISSWIHHFLYKIVIMFVAVLIMMLRISSAIIYNFCCFVFCVILSILTFEKPILGVKCESHKKIVQKKPRQELLIVESRFWRLMFSTTPSC